MVRDVIVYFDESGDPSLEFNKSGVSSYYVISAVVIDKNDEQQLIDGVKKIQNQFFSGSEIKSKNVGPDIKRRASILQAMSEIPFNSFTICIDKNKVSKDGGLIYKRPFIKFMNGLIYRKIFRTFPVVDIYCDQQGWPDFKESFKKYLETNHIPDIFTAGSITLVDSALCHGVQVADFIAGSVHHYFNDRNEDLWKLFYNKSMGVDLWPKYREASIQDLSVITDHDGIVEEYCINQATIFMQEYLDSTDEIRHYQVLALEYLMQQHYEMLDEPFSYTSEIMQAIGYPTSDSSDYSFRSKVIGGLRDEGVIIASSSRGLKIPTSVKDLTGFVDETIKKIFPMLHRLQAARTQIKLATLNKLDIMEGRDQEKDLLDHYNNQIRISQG